jgi:hypothetical protein
LTKLPRLRIHAVSDPIGRIHFAWIELPSAASDAEEDVDPHPFSTFTIESRQEIRGVPQRAAMVLVEYKERFSVVGVLRQARKRLFIRFGKAESFGELPRNSVFAVAL